jgi:hypothetical protein
MEQQLSLAVRNREQNRVILPILLLTLLYYIQEEFYIPRGIRTMYTDANHINKKSLQYIHITKVTQTVQISYLAGCQGTMNK